MFTKPANPGRFHGLHRLPVILSIRASAMQRCQGDALVMAFQATGAQFKLEPRDGDIFVASLMPTGQFGPVVDLDYMTRGLRAVSNG